MIIKMIRVIKIKGSYTLHINDGVIYIQQFKNYPFGPFQYLSRITNVTKIIIIFFFFIIQYMYTHKMGKKLKTSPYPETLKTHLVLTLTCTNFNKTTAHWCPKVTVIDSLHHMNMILWIRCKQPKMWPRPTYLFPNNHKSSHLPTTSGSRYTCALTSN